MMIRHLAAAAARNLMHSNGEHRTVIRGTIDARKAR